MDRTKDRQAGGLRRLIPAFGLALGLGLAVLPVAYDAWWAQAAERSITTLTDASDAGEHAQELLMQADAYNRRVARTQGIDVGDTTNLDVDAQETLPYHEQLGGSAGEAVAWLEVPSISVRLPIYLGTDDASLASGVGHVEGTSLPVGGPSAHAVLSGHSGLFASRMLDDIRQLAPGDTFAVHVLGRTCVYAVTGSAVVLPNETDTLGVRKGEDLCTLVTCTPYGVNDHRLLVYGTRTEDVSLPATRAKATGTLAPLESPRLIPLFCAVAIAGAGAVARWAHGAWERLPFLPKEVEVAASSSGRQGRHPHTPQVDENGGRS